MTDFCALTDASFAGAWAALLGAAALGGVLFHRIGLATTHVRDLLHVGAGVWVFGWPYWKSPRWPIAITVAAALAIWMVPLAARRVRALAAFRDSISDDDERWGGIAYYTISFAGLTWLAMHGHTFPSAAALLALSLGDGLGGAIGRAFGRTSFAVPGGKQKSLEGSAAVALFSTLGFLCAAAFFGVEWRASTAILIGMVAALAEALAPRGSDNLFVPIAVYAATRLVS